MGFGWLAAFFSALARFFLAGGNAIIQAFQRGFARAPQEGQQSTFEETFIERPKVDLFCGGKVSCGQRGKLCSETRRTPPKKS